MSESVQIAFIVLIALFIGALIPVLVTVRSTMKKAEHAIGQLEDRLALVLDQTAVVMLKVDKIGDELLVGTKSVSALGTEIDGITSSVRNMQSSIRLFYAVASSVSPAVQAALHSLQKTGCEADLPGGEAAFSGEVAAPDSKPSSDEGGHI